MLVSEVIRMLQAAQEEYGDLRFVMLVEGEVSDPREISKFMMIDSPVYDCRGNLVNIVGDDAIFLGDGRDDGTDE